MATNVELIHDQSRASAIALRWIISGREDLVWFIGSVVSSYLLFALYIAGVLPLLPMVALWAILIDAPHVFGTFSRTYFDRTERQQRGRLLWSSLAFFAVGPLLVLAGFGFVFFFVAALWAYYHLAKQHYGFMVLYKKKNSDLAPIDNALDRWLLVFAFNYPFVEFIARDPSAMARVPVPLRAGVNAVAMLFLAGTVLLGMAWVVRQLQRWWTEQPLNVPKYLLLAAAIPMHWVVLLTPMPNKPIAIVAILTIYHNLQYHRLIWFHNKKYTNTSQATQFDLRRKFGAATMISSSLVYYLAFGILFGLVYQGPRQFLGYLTFQQHPALSRVEPSLPIQLGISFLWGYAFIHYYLDSKIWRVRRDPNVGRALNMS